MTKPLVRSIVRDVLERNDNFHAGMLLLLFAPGLLLLPVYGMFWLFGWTARNAMARIDAAGLQKPNESA